MAGIEDPLDALRALMEVETPPLHALVVPSEDAHQVEKHMTENGIEIRNYETVLSDSELLSSGQLSGLCADKDKALKNGVLEESKALENEPNKNTDSEGKGALDKETKCSQSWKETVTQKHNLIWIDPGSCCYALYTKLPSDRVLQQQSPLALAKAIKNPVELDGLRKAHIRDGAAVVSYLVWLDREMQEIYGAAGYFSEVKGSNKRKYSLLQNSTFHLLLFTLDQHPLGTTEYFKGLSFPTISSVGPNAAIIHYAPKPETCSELQPDSIYLCDSGAQYLDGTTDITRTVHFGKPSPHEKACYTAVRT